MGYSLVSWAYKDPITIQKLTQMAENSIWTSEHRIFGCEINTIDTKTINVCGGSMDIDGKWLTRTSGVTLDVSATASWESVTGQQIAPVTTSTSIYVVAYNSAGGDWDVKFRSSGPAYTNSDEQVITGCPLLYDKTGSTYFRYIGQVVANSAGTLKQQHQRGSWVSYADAGSGSAAYTCDGLILTQTTVAGWVTASVGVGGKLIPPWCRMIQVVNWINGGGYIYYRAPEASLSGAGSNAAYVNIQGTYERVPVNASRELCYRASSTFELYIGGYDNSTRGSY